MIKAFETGKWYRYAGKKRKGDWNHEGEMDFCLDGAPHECTWGDGSYAKFRDSGDPDRSWTWDDDLDQWDEVAKADIGPFILVSIEKKRKALIAEEKALAAEAERIKTEQAKAPQDKKALAKYLADIGEIEAPALVTESVKALLVGIQEKIKEARAVTATSKPKKKA